MYPSNWPPLRPGPTDRRRVPARRPGEARPRAVTWAGLLVAMTLTAAGCGISVEDPGGATSETSDAARAEAIVDAFPTLASLSPDQLGELGIDLGADPEAVAEAVVESGATEATAGIDTTTSVSGTTIRQIRAAWAQAVLAPFAEAMTGLQNGTLDDIEAVPALDFTVREVATGLECRATAAPWLHVTRAALTPVPVRRNNDSKEGYRARLEAWIHSVAAIEQTVVDQLEPWVGGVPRRGGTSDPLCYLDAERDRQLIAGTDQPRPPS